MSIGVQVDQRVPLIIKKDLLPAFLRIPDLLRKLMENFLKRAFHLRISGHTVEICIRLKDMEQRIHRAVRHDAILRQLVVRCRLETDVQCLQISDPILHLCLDEAKLLHRHPQRFFVPGGKIIF